MAADLHQQIAHLRTAFERMKEFQRKIDAGYIDGVRDDDVMYATSDVLDAVDALLALPHEEDSELARRVADWEQWNRERLGIGAR